MRVLSVNIGQPRQVPDGSSRTGIYKIPVVEAVEVSELGLRGDSICNLKHHGGPDQAVYIYGDSDYRWWADILGHVLQPGTFGDNLTITDLESSRIHIGDRFHTGSVILEAAAPRIPCRNLAARMSDSTFAKRFREAERPGVYCRVIQEGRVQAGDAVIFEPVAGSPVRSLELFRDFYSPTVEEAAIRRYLAAPISIRDRMSLEERLRKLVIERHSVRAILITADREVLLLRIHEPGVEDYSWWITPGGGIEPGETVEQTLQRELREEVGLDNFEIGPLVWRRQHTFNWLGKRVCQNEQYYVVHADRFEPKMTDANEAKALDEFRWWPLTELTATTDQVTPLSLAEIVLRYLHAGAPQQPIDVETLVD